MHKTLKIEPFEFDCEECGATNTFKVHTSAKAKLITNIIAVVLFGGFMLFMYQCSQDMNRPPVPFSELPEIEKQVTYDIMIKKRLRDPDSFQGISWGSTGEASTRTFRSKNGFGGYVIETWEIDLDGEYIGPTRSKSCIDFQSRPLRDKYIL